MRFGKPFATDAMELDFLRLQIAEQYGWTLEYIDTLPHAMLYTILGMRVGKNRASAKS